MTELEIQTAADGRGIEAADTLFHDGRFPEAEALYARAATNDPSAVHAQLQLGKLALFRNGLKEAERRLAEVVSSTPSSVEAKLLLSETLYRQDRFKETARLLRGVDDLKANLLSLFEDMKPYSIEGTAEETRVPFVQTDPIPVVAVRINGRDTYFIIDTGGSEVYLEPEFAAEAGAVLAPGSEQAGFAAGQMRPVQKGRIDTLELGGLTIRNLPVNIVDTKFIGSDVVAPGRKIGGFIGTVLLYHFLATIDYARGELVLRPRGGPALQRFEDAAARGDQISVPFWMVGDHFLVTWAAAHGSARHQFLIDTGGAGVGFVPGPAFVRTAGVDVPNAGVGWEKAGAWGIRFEIDAVSLGPLTERNLTASYGPFPAAVEELFGFYLAGIVTHQFFRPYALTIDFTGMRFFLERPQSAGT